MFFKLFGFQGFAPTVWDKRANLYPPMSDHKVARKISLVTYAWSLRKGVHQGRMNNSVAKEALKHPDKALFAPMLVGIFYSFCNC